MSQGASLRENGDNNIPGLMVYGLGFRAWGFSEDYEPRPKFEGLFLGYRGLTQVVCLLAHMIRSSQGRGSVLSSSYGAR